MNSSYHHSLGNGSAEHHFQRWSLGPHVPGGTVSPQGLVVKEEKGILRRRIEVPLVRRSGG